MAALAGIGLLAGLFGAILGVGGGVVIVPALSLLRYDQRRAAATSMGAIGLTAAVGAISYAAHGHVHGVEAAIVGVPAAAGAVAGTALQQRLPLRLLSLFFAALVAFAGVRLLEPSWFGFEAIQHRAWWVYLLAVSIGLFAGVLAGLFGVGGGVLLVPTLALALGLAQIEAEATSLLAMLPAAWLGAWRQTRYGNVDWRSSLTIGIVAIAGVEGGIAIAEALPEATLRRVFGGFLLLIAAQTAWSARRRRAPMLPVVSDVSPDEVWIPLVDEPIGSIVQQVQAEHPEIARLVETPQRILAFRTFAYIRVGILLGQLLVEHEVPDYDGSKTWVDALLEHPEHHAAVVREVRTVAEEIAADPEYAGEEPLGPDDEARARFRDFARRKLGSA